MEFSKLDFLGSTPTGDERLLGLLPGFCNRLGRSAPEKSGGAENPMSIVGGCAAGGFCAVIEGDIAGDPGFRGVVWPGPLGLRYPGPGKLGGG